LSKTRFFNSD
jgi:hypothetical protein